MKIQGLSDLSIITNFSIERCVFNHTTCFFKVSLSCNDIKFKNTKIGELIEIKKDSKLVFKGVVQAIKIQDSYGQILVEVELVSTSILQDKTFITRIFQDSKKKYSDILSTLKKDGLNIDCESSVSSKPIKNVVTQINETNFEFLKRICKSLNLNLWTLDDKFVIGDFIKESNYVFDDKDILFFSTFLNENEEILEIHTRKNEFIGNKVKYNNKEFIITKHVIVKDHGDYINKYTLTKKSSKHNYNHTNHQLKTLLKVCEGIVEDNEDPDNLGRLKVSFMQDVLEDITPNERTWCDFIVPYTMFRGKAGISFMPEKGDLVKVYIYENEMIVVGCIRKRVIDKSIKEPKEKFIQDPYGNIVKFNEEGLTLYNENADLKITKEDISFKIGESLGKLDKDNIEFKLNDSKINIKNDSILFNLGDSSVQIKKDKIVLNSSKIEISSKDDTAINSKNIKIDAKSNVEIKGNSIELK